MASIGFFWSTCTKGRRWTRQSRFRISAYRSRMRPLSTRMPSSAITSFVRSPATGRSIILHRRATASISYSSSSKTAQDHALSRSARNSWPVRTRSHSLQRPANGTLSSASTAPRRISFTLFYSRRTIDIFIVYCIRLWQLLPFSKLQHPRPRSQ